MPGPGTYGKGGIPSAIVEDKERKSVSNVGMLDSGKSFRRQLPEVVCNLFVTLNSQQQAFNM